MVLGTLAGPADPAALQLALSLLSHPGIRAEAEQAVRTMAGSVKRQHPETAREALRQLRQRRP